MVVDVFIPKKRSKLCGLCFAFVKFRHEVEALLACEKVDGSTLEGFVLEVNISRYPRIGYNFGSDSSSGQREGGGGHVGRCFGVKSHASLTDGISGMNSAGGDASVYTPAHLRVEPGLYSAQRLKSGDVSGKNSYVGGNGAIGSGVKSAATSKVGPGFSYAQILNSGVFAKGVLQGKCCGKSGPSDVSGSLALFYENPEHLQAILNNRVGLEDVPVRYSSLCVAEPFVVNKVSVEVIDCILPRTGSFAFDPMADDLCSRRVGWGRGGEHVNSNVLSSAVWLFSEEGDDVLAESSSKCAGNVAFQTVGAIYEKAKDLGAKCIEEVPLTAEEKAEIIAEVRAIVHDAFQIGKTTGINFMPRDESMIKIFTALRHLDKDKWRMNFDDDADPI